MKTKQLEYEAFLLDSARRAGFVLLRDAGCWRVYHDPTEVCLATDAASLERLLARVDNHVRSGGEAAGLFHYEAGYALEPTLVPLRKGRKAILAWFGLYEHSRMVNDLGSFQPTYVENK
jgi:hypothetical protein